MDCFVNFHLSYCPFSDIGILYRNNIVNKLSEDRLMLGFYIFCVQLQTMV